MPVASAVVARESLVEALDRAPDRGVTLISAPPGAGKTFVLRQWLQRKDSGVAVAALTVVRSEHDPQRFWLTMLAAVREAVGDPAAADAPTPAPDVDGVALVDLVVGTLSEIDRPLIVVIDDLHELESAEATAQLEEVLQQLPERVRVVLCTRRDPNLHLHRLRLQGELTELRGDDLQFTLRETRALLESSGIALPSEAIAQLHTSTEGWAAGLRLAAISLLNHPDPARFISDFSGTNRTVAEYLLAEMLDRQPPEVRDLLLQTSILERVNAPLADLLAGATGSQRILEQLEDANSFVLALDPDRTWFRYHRLFSDLLRLELRRGSPGAVADLHRSAARWLAEHDQSVDAMRHAQAGGDWEFAARLLAEHALSLTLDGEEATVRAVLDAFPAAVVESDPELIVLAAADRVAQGSLSEAAGYLEIAADKAEPVDPKRRSRLAVAVATTRLALARRRGDFSDVTQQVALLASRGEIHCTADVALGSELRALALMNLGTVEMWSLRLDDAQSHLLEGARLARQIGRPYLEVTCLAHLGFAAHGESLASAREQCTAAIRLAEKHGWATNHVVAPALAALGGTLTFSGEFHEAGRLLDQTESALRPEIAPATSLLFHLSRGMLDVGLERPAAALAHFRAAEQMQTLLVTQHALAVQVRGYRVAMQIRLGQFKEAAATAAEIAAEDNPWGESLTALATVRLAQKRPDDALAALEPVLDGRVPVIHAFSTVHAQMIAAQVWVNADDRRASEQAVEAALDLAEPDRLVLPFAMADALSLLARHPRHATAHASLLTQILDILAHGDGQGAVRRELVEPLSPTELRVLRHLPGNLTTPELANELFLSTNTVKTHMRRIYAKLDAHSRSEAVRRARQLGLLSRHS
jgi:LuxR family transcriptional regulator, maltose regulon positive regulatory protein